VLTALAHCRMAVGLLTRGAFQIWQVSTKPESPEVSKFSRFVHDIGLTTSRPGNLRKSESAV
jgi:hypothetical protein